MPAKTVSHLLQQSPFTDTKNNLLLGGKSLCSTAVEKSSAVYRTKNILLEPQETAFKRPSTHSNTSTTNKFLCLDDNLAQSNVESEVLEREIPENVQLFGSTMEDIVPCVSYAGFFEEPVVKKKKKAFSRVECQLQQQLDKAQLPSFAFSTCTFGSSPSSNEIYGFQKSHCISPKRWQMMPSLSNQVPFPTSHLFLNRMPVYHFEALQFEESIEPAFHSLENDNELLRQSQVKELAKIKIGLISIVSASLIYSPNLKNSNDPMRLLLLKCADTVAAVDPEFVLKVALYTRQELNIRSVANFLLAYSAYENLCRPYLRKYFVSSIRLPSDWIDVAEQYQVFQDSHLKFGSLPAALRKVMKVSFQQFDQYQLAKYNRDKRKMPKKQKQIGLETKTDDEKKKTLKQKLFTLKHLIRLLHITSPTENVMCLLGKKYPENSETFQQSGLPGIWDSEKAGKRMKLPVPETWETMVASKGNKAFVWESLIDNSKLPYMALLRNLRNLIIAGISLKHHEKIISFLSNEHAVIKSRQFPLRFYSAFKVIEDLESLSANGENIIASKKSNWNKCYKRKPYQQVSIPVWKIKQRQKIIKRKRFFNEELLQKYKEAICKAVETAAHHNLSPISGKTLVICDLTNPLTEDPDKVYNSLQKTYHGCIMLGLMCLIACEECEMKVIPGTGPVETVKLHGRSFLENMTEICAKYEDVGNMDDEEDVLSHLLQQLLDHYLKTDIMMAHKLDNIILLISGEDFENGDGKKIISSFLHKYRHLVNPDLLYVQVELAFSAKSCNNITSSANENDVYLRGFSDQLLKFIAERRNGGQLAYVENIDQKYSLMKSQDLGILKLPSKLDLSNKNQQLIPIYDMVPRWETVRVFISSTFKDMHSERDLLLRYVLPELKARAANLFVRINEIDLRWGITENDAASKRSAELCLSEVQNCHFFVGILGERYGSICDINLLDDPQFDWVKDYPPGASITELEMHCGALQNPDSRERAFFYIRDNSFISQVPQRFVQLFSAEDDNSKAKVSALKQKILSSGVEVFNGYPCHFAGVLNECPVVAGLDDFGNRVLNNLWNAICKFYKKEDHVDEATSEQAQHQSQIEKHKWFVGEGNLPLNYIVGQIKAKSGIFFVTGKPGCGKTSFLVQILKEIKGELVIPYFVGITPRSNELNFILSYIAFSIAQHVPYSSELPKTSEGLRTHFIDILKEGSKASFSGNLILLIDGLDHLEIEAQLLDWLPYEMPTGVKLICSASESTLVYKTLSKREKYGSAIEFVPLKPLNMPERQQIVRHNLEQHRKVLDESPFNNQMLQLVTKGDGGNPLFLQLACDYLRIFTVFENLMPTLQRFPPILSQVLEKIIVQMEFEHGINMVQIALSLMCIVKEGLDENELHILLSIAGNKSEIEMELPLEDVLFSVSDITPDTMISSIEFRSLLHMLKTFAFPYGNLSHGNLKLASSEFSRVVEKYYQNDKYKHRIQYLHKLLAAYYKKICDPQNDETWKGYSASAFRSLPYHLIRGKCYKELANILCSLSFLRETFKLQAAEEILEYFDTLLHTKDRKSNINIQEENFDFKILQDFCDFVTRNMHILKCTPFLVDQQALNEPSGSAVNNTSLLSKTWMMEWITRAYSTNYCSLTVSEFITPILCVALHSTDHLAVLGSEDGSIKMLNISTGKITQTLKGDYCAITSVCFAGNDKICSSALDNTISLWTLNGYYRTAILKGHTFRITSLCPNPQGSIVVSTAWDCTLRLWSIHDGRQISCFEDNRYPINCVTHHPQQQEVAYGLWNKTIVILDTISLKKIAVLKGHSGSVKSAAYSPNGLEIISSSITAEVIIWSAIERFQISKLEGHTLPVNSISCPEGDIVVTCSDDSTLKVWPIQQGSVVFKFCHDTGRSVRFMEIIAPNLLAASFQNSGVSLYDITDGHIVFKFDSSSDPVSCFSKQCEVDEKHYECLLFGTTSGFIKEITLTDKRDEASFGCMKAALTCMAHTEFVVLCGTANGDVALFSLLDHTPYGEIYGTHEGSVTALSIASIQRCGIAMSASTDMTLKLWKFDSSKDDLTFSELETYPSKHRDFVTSCYLHKKTSFSTVNRAVTMITGSNDNTVIIWDDEKEHLLEGLQTSVSTLHCTGKFLLACAQNGSIAVWTKTGKLVSKIPGIEQSSLIFAFDFQKGKENVGEFYAHLVYVDKDGKIAVKKPFQRSQLCTLQGHREKVTSCSVDRNGTILSCSRDKTVNVWTIPSRMENFTAHHVGNITCVALPPSGLITINLALSADICGNLVLWIINKQCKKLPLRYAARKEYIGGNINAVLWLEETNMLCAVRTVSGGKEKYFIEYLASNVTLQQENGSYVIQAKSRKFFDSEITSTDYLREKYIIAVGLKSGEVHLVNSKEQSTLFKLSEDWILQLKLVSNETTVLCTTQPSGIMKCCSLNSLSDPEGIFAQLEVDLPEENSKTSLPLWSSALCTDKYGKIYVGDTSGRLIVVCKMVLCCKQIHSAAVSSMGIAGSHLFTSSLDRTVKVWNLETLNQIGQFHCPVPISCLAVPETDWNPKERNPILLMFGTVVGNVHCLIWRQPEFPSEICEEFMDTS